MYSGYVHTDDRCVVEERLHGSDGVTTFLKAHLFDQGVVRITPLNSAHTIFEARDGIDLHSELQQHGVDLPRIYKEIKEEVLAKESSSSEAREPWEGLYDSIGMTPSEISQRQHLKAKTKIRADRCRRCQSSGGNVLSGALRNGR